MAGCRTAMDRSPYLSSEPLSSEPPVLISRLPRHGETVAPPARALDRRCASVPDHRRGNGDRPGAAHLG